ncbi:MAG: AAA family ATPase [Ectothiorhodospiraceae bacterium]|nr:AAA family ATPase [Ectothiorhodospiraceae bacterium]
MTNYDQAPTVRVTEIGEYVRHNSCERRFKLGFNQRSLARRLPFAERLFNPLDPVLQEVGHQREAEWERSLREGAGFEDLSHYDARPAGSKKMPFEEFKDVLGGLPRGREAYAREVEISGRIGAFHVQGRVDFVVLLWRDGQPVLRLVECKASRRDRTYHQLQVALYQRIFEDLLGRTNLFAADVPISAGDIECVVARIDEQTNEGQQILALAPLDTHVIAEDIDHLLSEAGPLNRIVESGLDELGYKIEAKCDNCIFNVDCLPESARMRRLELLGLDPSDVRALHAAGIDTIDALADLDLTGVRAAEVRQAQGFSGNLEAHVAGARARRSTLPGGNSEPDSFEVEPLPNRWESQLPAYEMSGQRLVRIYMCVDYDYTENRIGALSAHVTTSDGSLITPFEQADGRWRPAGGIIEEFEDGAGRVERPVQGVDVVRFKTSRWSGIPEDDNASERELIQGFLHELIDAIAQQARSAAVPIHFYIWSRSEMRQLVEGCTRSGSSLLAHLNQLLGCRESLEQLIFSTVGEEVTNRFALGWTGRGLSVVTSLRWFGKTYHWTRTIGGERVELDRVFTQDLFDFKTDLAIDDNGGWARGGRGHRAWHKFEIRSRFNDSLPAPYWHAVWRTLPNPDDELPANVRNAISRYNEAARPLRLREYLRSRVHALRWVEERIRFKNNDIEKPPLEVAELAQFDLGVETAAQAAHDFLRLEQHIRMAHWISQRLVAPVTRVSLGQTIPVRSIRATGDNQLEGEIDLTGYDVTREALEERAMLAEGAFVRLTPCSGDPSRAQSMGQLLRAGSTCIIQELDWNQGRIRLSVLPMRRADHFRLMSISRRAGERVFDFATVDESPSDFVAVRVERRLLEVAAAATYRWFDPTGPRLPEKPPLDEQIAGRVRNVLSGIVLPGGHGLSDDQQQAVLDGLDVTVQLLQGPPGTGKTQTTAIAVQVRSMMSLRPGSIVLVAANTHTAVDNLLIRIAAVEEAVGAAARAQGLHATPLSVAKVHSSDASEQLPAPVGNLPANSCARAVGQARRDGVAVLGGTTSALLSMAQKLSSTAKFQNGFQADLLVVDEASMMVFPYFLALTTLVDEGGGIMLAGDHRQLAPILAHDWEHEDRPPVLLFQPFVSAYDAVRNLSDHAAVSARSIRRSALEYTFRLPPVVRGLIAQLYRLDNIELQGPQIAAGLGAELAHEGVWGAVWGASGLFLVVHDERESRKSNVLEARIVREILEVGRNQPADSIAVVTPHRAQRTLLQRALADHRDIAPVVDTVERLQGGQRPTVIISATASDPAAIAASVEFILDLNRSNVAFSRVQQRLVVVCSESLLNYIAPELEHYESAMLWKSLRAACRQEVVATNVDGHQVRVLTPDQGVLGEAQAEPNG